MESKKAIFVLGPPNSGKGTQAELLAKKLGFYHFITSKEGLNYISAHRDDSETLKQEENYKAGILYDPKWLVEKVLKERTKDVFEDFDGIVYDGSPRTLFESEKLFEFLSGLIGCENIYVLEIFVSEEELRKRLTERLVCGKDPTAHVFSARLQKNIKIGDKCPQCDGVLGRRDLDSVFDIRMEQYKNRTSPGLDYLKKNHDKVFTVNGEQSIDDVFKAVVSVLKL